MLLVTPVSAVTCRPMDLTSQGSGSPLDLWERGMALRDSEPAEALRLLQAARDGDPASVRAPSIAAVAFRSFDQSGVTVLDADQLLPREPGLDAPAEALFVDGLHLSEWGHTRLADLVAPRVEALLE